MKSTPCDVQAHSANDCPRWVVSSLWAAHSLSATGCAITRFALGVWLFRNVGSTAAFTWALLLTSLPGAVMLSLAGVALDRYDRRRLLLVADVVIAICVATIVGLAAYDALRVWIVVVLAAVMSAASTCELIAVTTVALQRATPGNVSRASGFSQLAPALAQCLGILVAGVLYERVGLVGAVTVDLIVHLLAISVIWLLPAIVSPALSHARTGWWKETVAGWALHRLHHTAGRLLVHLAIFTFLVAVAQVVITPFLLKRSTPEVLAYVISAGAFGTVAGSALMSAWVGSRRPSRTLLAAGLCLGMGFVLCGASADVRLIGAGFFLASAAIPVVMSSTQVMLLDGSPEFLGRILATRRLTARVGSALALVCAGPAVDLLFEPVIGPRRFVGSILHTVIGDEPAAGIGLLLVVVGSVLVLLAIVFDRILLAAPANAAGLDTARGFGWRGR